MAINYELINKGGISLGTNFELLGEKPLDARLVVPSLDGLAHLISEKAAYAGMIVYVTSEDKHYQVTADGTYREFGITADELKNLIATETTAAMEFKGATASLPEEAAKGDMYKVTAAFTVGDEEVKVGDSIVYDGETWFVIPSGDDIEDTWRTITGVNNDATLTFAAGDKLDVAVTAEGTVTYSHEAVDAPELLAENEQTRTYITEVVTDGFGHITGYKTATENVVDTNTEYTFTSQTESSSVYFQVVADTEGADAQTVYVDAYSKNETDLELAKKVDKVTGYSLVSDDEIARLADVDNYNDEEVRGLISDNADAISDLVDYVGTIPSEEAYKDITNVISYVNKKAEETLAAASGNSTETAASVKQQLDNYKSENNTRVKDVEDAVAAINNADTGLLKQAKDYADGLAGNYDEAGAAAAAEAAAKLYADGLAGNYDEAGAASAAQSAAEAKAAELDAALKSELEGKINGVDGKLANYVTTTKYNEDKLAEDAIDADHETRIAAVEAKFGTGEGNVESQIAAAVSAEEQRATGVEGELRTDVNDALARVKAIEDAPYVTKSQLDEVDGKFSSYNTTEAQKKIDDAQDVRIKAIEDTYLVAADIADLATKTSVQDVVDDLAEYVEANDKALAGVKATAEAAAVKTDVDAALEARYTKTEVDNKFETITNVALKADKTYVNDELAKKVNVSDYNSDKATFATKEELKGVSDRVTVVEGILNDAGEGEDLTKGLVSRVADLEAIDHDQLAVDAAASAVATILDEAPEAFDTLKEVAEWIAASESAAEAADLVTRVATLEALDHEAYVAADTALHTVISKEIDDDVQAAINAEVSRANGAYDVKGAADDAKDAAIADAAGKYETIGTAQGIVDALKLSETYEPIGAESRAKADAAEKYETKGTAQGIVDGLKLSETYEPIGAESRANSYADGKFEEKGVAQGIVDGLKLSETYEPIGAESRAIAAAKTETENQIKALTDGAIADIMDLLTWGEF